MKDSQDQPGHPGCSSNADAAPTPSATYRPAIIISFATMFAMGLTLALLGPSLPGLAGRTNVSLDQAGILFSLFAGGSLLSTLFLARLVDLPVRHGLLIGGCLLAGGALWAVSLSSTLGQAGLAIAVCGVAMSATGVSPNAIVAETFGRRAGPALNGLHLLAGAGAFLSPLLVGMAIKAGGDYRVAFQIIGSGELLLGAAWSVARLPRPRHLAGSTASRQRSIAASAPLVMLLFFAMLYVGTEQLFGGWIFTYARQATALDAATASLATSAFWLAILCGRLAAMRLLPRTTGPALMAAGVLMGGFGIGLVLLGSLLPILLWPGIGLVGLGFGPLFPTAMAEAAGTAPNNVGMASSLLAAASSGGSMVLPWASGTLIAAYDIRATIASGELPLPLMLLCLYLFSRQWRATR